MNTETQSTESPEEIRLAAEQARIEAEPDNAPARHERLAACVRMKTVAYDVRVLAEMEAAGAPGIEAMKATLADDRDRLAAALNARMAAEFALA